MTKKVCNLQMYQRKDNYNENTYLVFLNMYKLLRDGTNSATVYAMQEESLNIA